MKILLTLLMLLSPLAYSADTPGGAVSEFTANSILHLTLLEIVRNLQSLVQLLLLKVHLIPKQVLLFQGYLRPISKCRIWNRLVRIWHKRYRQVCKGGVYGLRGWRIYTSNTAKIMKILLTLLMLLSPLAYSADTPGGAVSEFTANEGYPLKQTWSLRMPMRILP
jgi:hypothetical protein